MKPTVLTKKEFEIMVTIWDLGRAVSFNDILVANKDINRNTLLAALRKLQSYGMIQVTGFGYHKNSLTRLFEGTMTKFEYFSQFMNHEQKKEMIHILMKQLKPEEQKEIQEEYIR